MIKRKVLKFAKSIILYIDESNSSTLAALKTLQICFLQSYVVQSSGVV